MPIDSGNLALKGLDELFSTEEKRQEEQREQVQQIPIDELHPFTNHPFKVVDDEAMTRTVESIAQFGVLAPLIARPRPDGDGYEIISGHRRQFAAKMAGLETLPVIVRDMDDDAATILMVDSNLQREHISPSERAFAYKMKMLLRQNRGVSSVEIDKTNIKGFERYAKKYGIDYAIRKDTSEVPPRYLVFFKAPDAEAFHSAFKEYSASLLNKDKRPSVLAKLHELVQAAAELPGKVRHKEQERGL